ncbi:MAG: hypothetical protein MJY62_00585 [Bacteroidales bacterium]|nr:hypothetical protein [Bacteroidales bacterium]
MKSSSRNSGYQRPETTEISVLEAGVLCTSPTVGIDPIVEDEETLTF